MREYLIKRLLERLLPETRPDEDFFSAGPPSAAARKADTGQHDALLADVRRQRSHSRHSVA
jgi:hypothetical protein